MPRPVRARWAGHAIACLLLVVGGLVWLSRPAAGAPATAAECGSGGEISITATPCQGFPGDTFTLAASFPCSTKTNSTGKYTWDTQRNIIADMAQDAGDQVSATVPSDATPGVHTITGTCFAPTGGETSASTPFTVLTKTTTPTTTAPTTAPTTTVTTRTTTPTTVSSTKATHTTANPTTTQRTTVATTTPTPTLTPTTTASHHGATTAPPTTHATTTPPTTEPPTASTKAHGLKLSSLAIAPGGQLHATGTGCRPNSSVALSIGGTSVGRTRADGTGSFVAPLHLGSIPVGRYKVSAACGALLTAPLDVVLASQVSPETSTLALIVFFLLIGLFVFRRRALPPRPTARGRR